MALQQCFRTYSTDSVGSDGVFTEDSYYQGMLKATEGRKDERDRVQKKTFTKWVNKHLMKVSTPAIFTRKSQLGIWTDTK